MTPQSLVDAGLDLGTLVQTLYGDVDGYGLSNAGRERIGVSGENFVYGEVTPEVVFDILRVCEARPGETFYDLGSGTGKGVLYASLLSDLGKCVGIEILEELHDSAQMSHGRYKEYVLPHLPDKHWQKIEYHCTDMLTHDFSDADIVFMHCTCFNPETMAALTAKVDQLKPGARVITVSKELPSQNYAALAVLPVQMAWGAATAYVWKRI